MTHGFMRFLMALVLCGGLAHAEQIDPMEPEDPAETEQVEGAEEPVSRDLTAEEEGEIQNFREPIYTENERNVILQAYNFVDPQFIVPPLLLVDALLYFHTNQNLFKNKNVISIMDYSPHSKTQRLYVINMNTGEVLRAHAAHGTGSDPKSSGFARRFSNKRGSNMSSLGYVRTAETYYGKHGYSLRLDGLSESNANMRRRAVVVHGAKYVVDRSVRQGRSYGCIAVSRAQHKKIIDMIKGGSLILAGQSGLN